MSWSKSTIDTLFYCDLYHILEYMIGDGLNIKGIEPQFHYPKLHSFSSLQEEDDMEFSVLGFYTHEFYGMPCENSNGYSKANLLEDEY